METVFVVGSGGAIFEMDFTEELRDRLEKGELRIVVPDAPDKPARKGRGKAAPEPEPADEDPEAEVKDE
jgi:hypothetical protein